MLQVKMFTHGATAIHMLVQGSAVVSGSSCFFGIASWVGLQQYAVWKFPGYRTLYICLFVGWWKNMYISD